MHVLVLRIIVLFSSYGPDNFDSSHLSLVITFINLDINFDGNNYYSEHIT